MVGHTDGKEFEAQPVHVEGGCNVVYDAHSSLVVDEVDWTVEELSAIVVAGRDVDTGCELESAGAEDMDVRPDVAAPEMVVENVDWDVGLIKQAPSRFM